MQRVKRQTRCMLTLLVLHYISLQVSAVTFADTEVVSSKHNQVAYSTIAEGRRLLGELNCTNCHQAGSQLQHALSVKQPPHLFDVGNRLDSLWMFQYLMEPQIAQPGTTMPDVLHGLPIEKKATVVDEIVSYLSSLQPPAQLSTGRGVAWGQQLYNTIGCVACHGTPEVNKLSSEKKFDLQYLGEKYKNASALAAFLVNPHQLRPSGRMPGMHLSFDEAHAISRYLGVDAISRNGDRSGVLIDGLKYERFGNIDHDVSLAMLERSAPTYRWVTNGFSYPPFRHRIEAEWILQSGYLEIKEDGNKSFALRGNSAASLWIGDFNVCKINGDGASEPHAQGEIFLRKGMHAIRLLQFSNHVTKTVQLIWKDHHHAFAEIPQRLLKYRLDGQMIFQNINSSNINRLDLSSKIASGKQHFETYGCANCHQTTQIPNIDGANAYLFNALPVASLGGDQLSGCINDDNDHNGINTQTVRYTLSDDERCRIGAALSHQDKISDTKEIDRVNDVVKTMNCTGCHSERALFETMPRQLQLSWLKEAIVTPKSSKNELAKRMPQYGKENVLHIAGGLKGAVHSLFEGALPVVAEGDDTSNHMVSIGASCVSCHAGNPSVSEMDHWSRRYEARWFVEYLQSASSKGGDIHHLIEGNVGRQAKAIWSYADGLSQNNQGEFVVLADHNNLDANFDITKTSLSFYNVQGVPYWATPRAGPDTNTSLGILNIKRQSHVWNYFGKDAMVQRKHVGQERVFEPYYTGKNLYKKKKNRLSERISIGDILRSCFDESTLRKSKIPDLVDKFSGKKSFIDSNGAGNQVRIKMKLKLDKADIKISYRY